MFGLIKRDNKEACVYCVLNKRTKNSLLPLLIKNVATKVDEFEI